MGPLMDSGEAQWTHVVAGSVRCAGLTPFLLVSSGLMKLPHDLPLKIGASSSADSVAGLSEQQTLESNPKVRVKQTSGVTYLWWRAACVASVERARRSPNSWPHHQCHGRTPNFVKHFPLCVPARHAMSVHVTYSSPPFRMAANAASRKTDGAPYGSRPMRSGLTGLQIVGLEEPQRRA